MLYIAVANRARTKSKPKKRKAALSAAFLFLLIHLATAIHQKAKGAIHKFPLLLFVKFILIPMGLSGYNGGA
ncbi:MAG: hypothetical protein DCF19_20535 [Pseudanabaena frigida]|uniref:Uncharacterized protein n=1 Tax=Pseudanabaena frigida TaxID=945775 RepID=A0A2W4VZU8_9CYAN|nr:MAG: hypothetical protein DCF19_20535 [Pseudanabaena frigida]